MDETDFEDSGWPTFAGIVTSLLGVFNMAEGLLTMFNERYGAYVGGYFFLFNLTGWGWLHLVLGIALLAVGVALLARIEWAPAIAVGLAGATAIFQMIYVNIVPHWSWINVVLSMLVIYALVVKGRDTLATMPPYRAAPVVDDDSDAAERDRP